MCQQFDIRRLSTSCTRAGKFKERFEKLRAKAPASADPEADFKALLAEFSKTGSDARVGMKQVPEIGVMFSQWLERDDRAALAYIAEAYQQPGPSRIVTVRWRSIRR